MTKKLNIGSITNELAGSAFFRQNPQPGKPEQTLPTPPPEKPVRHERSGTQAAPVLPTPRLDVSKNTDLMTAPPQVRQQAPLPAIAAMNRPVKPRHGFDIYQDQYEALLGFSNEEKLQGGTGSMSAMAREALDDYIAKRKKH